MAHHDDKYHRYAQVDAWEHLLGYAVFDRQGDKIGTVKALWEDYTRQPAYLGIATSWLDLGRIHLVPAQFATLSERQKCLRLSSSADVVKGAPECHANDEITPSGETKIRDYYDRKGIGTVWGRGPGGSTETQLHEDRPIRSADWTARDRREEPGEIYNETPVAEPVRPREDDPRPHDTAAKSRDEDDFIPLRKDPSWADRRFRERDRDDPALS